MAKKNHYVDNRAFLAAFEKYLPVVRPLREKWRKESAKLLAKGIPKDQLPKFVRPQTPDYDYIGECLLKIANHLAFKYTFIGSFSILRDEMVGDALENAIAYMENFDPEKTKNPFAYFTQIMTYAFYRRMEKERKQFVIKKKSLDRAMEFFSTQQDDDGAYANTYVEFMREVGTDVVREFEEKKAAKRQKNVSRKKKKEEDPGVDKFMVSVDEPAAA